MRPSARFHLSARPLRAVASLLAFLVLPSFVFALGCGGGSGSSSSAPGGSGDASPAPAPAATPAPTAAGPAPSGAEVGAKVFATRCALCHGPDGHGDGPGSAALNPKPRNFHDKAYMSTRTDAQLLEVIHQGKGAMPKWGGVLSEAEISAVLAHIRELGTKP